MDKFACRGSIFKLAIDDQIHGYSDYVWFSQWLFVNFNNFNWDEVLGMLISIFCIYFNFEFIS